MIFILEVISVFSFFFLIFKDSVQYSNFSYYLGYKNNIVILQYIKDQKQSITVKIFLNYLKGQNAHIMKNKHVKYF